MSSSVQMDVHRHLMTRRQRRQFSLVILIIVFGILSTVLWGYTHTFRKKNVTWWADHRYIGVLGYVTVYSRYEQGNPPVLLERRSEFHPVSFSITLAMTVGALWLAIRVQRHIGRPLNSWLRCDECGYDLRSLSVNRCPECGKSFYKPDVIADSTEQQQ